MKIRLSYLKLLFWFFAGSTLLFTGCKSTRKTTTYQPVTRPDPVSVPEVKAPLVEIKDIKKNPIKIKIALLMPFELRENFADTGITSLEPMVTSNSLQALNFYEGALMAKDSLKSAGRDVSIMAYDVPPDSSGISRLFTNSLLKEAEVVIATIPNSLASAAAGAASRNGINLILTQASSPELLENRSNVALAYTSTLTQCREMVAFMTEKYPYSNVILVYRTIKREDELADAFRNELLKKKDKEDFKELNSTDKAPAELVKLLSKTKRNLLFVISSDEAFVSPLLSHIEAQSIYGLIVCGLPTWQNFESINFMSFDNLQVNIFDNNFIDLQNPSRSLFRRQFINRYFNDPLPSAYNGFELIYHIANSIDRNNIELDKTIRKSFSLHNPNYNFTEYKSGGLENKSISVLRFIDYKLEPVTNK